MQIKGNPEKLQPLVYRLLTVKMLGVVEDEPEWIAKGGYKYHVSMVMGISCYIK